MNVKGFKDTIQWYNQNAEKYAETTKAHVDIEEINDFVEQLPENSTVLDAGCGSGRYTNELAERGPRAFGLDLSSGLINEAKKSFPDLEFQVGNMISLPFPNAYFNGIWAHASLLHFEGIEDVKKALNEFNRVTKFEGILHTVVKAQTGESKTAVVKDKISQHDRFFQYFKLDEFKQLLQDEGFEIIKTEEYRESDKNPNGRPEVNWIHALSRKK